LSFFNTGTVEGLKLLSSSPLPKNSTFGFLTAQSADDFFDQHSSIDASSTSLNKILFPEAFDSRFAQRGGYKCTAKGVWADELGMSLDGTPEKRSLGFGHVKNSLFVSGSNDRVYVPSVVLGWIRGKKLLTVLPDSDSCRAIN
jgi:hypothetical protein